MRFLKLISAMAGLLLLAACANYHPAKYALHTELVAPYRLDSGDQLRVIVFGQSDLTNSYTVDKAGMITMPLIGTVGARGRTPTELEEAIAAKLRAGYLRKPDVSVEVERYRPFFVMGEVTAGGQYTYVPGMTVQSAVAIAGGFTPRANQSSVKVTRSMNGEMQTGRLRMTDPVWPGDTIYVGQRIF